jgi:hypothetical protein
MTYTFAIGILMEFGAMRLDQFMAGDESHDIE